jgi:hypothetical protein
VALTGTSFACDKITDRLKHKTGGSVIKQRLLGVALALATATLAAQAPKPAAAAARPKDPPPTAAPKTATPPSQKAQSPYVPAIMQKTVTVAGCLKRGTDWELTDATVAGQKDKATYKLEGISPARLSLFVGKRIEATGALAGDGKPAAGKNLPRFEATAVKEAAGGCP